jgi:hypothetical protein
MYYTLETLLNHVFEDLRKTKAPQQLGLDHIFLNRYANRTVDGEINGRDFIIRALIVAGDPNTCGRNPSRCNLILVVHTR